MNSESFTVMSNYGLESETFVQCRKNWEFYRNQNKSVKCFFYREQTNPSTIEIHYDGYDHLVAVDENRFPRTVSEYDKTGNWSVQESKRGMERWKNQLRYTLKETSDLWIVCVNITAFFDFLAISSILPMLPKSGLYAGWPLYYRPEGLLYHSGSGLIFSRDVAQILLEQLELHNYNGHEAADLVWGKVLKDIPRTVLPFAQITPEDTAKTDLIDQLKAADRAIDEGQFMFRIKNLRPGLLREYQDPQIHLYIMLQTLLKRTEREHKFMPLIAMAFENVKRGIGMTVIG
jgi:hypothetical protein